MEACYDGGYSSDHNSNYDQEDFNDSVALDPNMSESSLRKIFSEKAAERKGEIINKNGALVKKLQGILNDLKPVTDVISLETMSRQDKARCGITEVKDLYLILKIGERHYPLTLLPQNTIRLTTENINVPGEFALQGPNACNSEVYDIHSNMGYTAFVMSILLTAAEYTGEQQAMNSMGLSDDDTFKPSASKNVETPPKL